ncbi:MAG: pyridoxamine 5'-phosphate oxidase [Chitinophagales bacterium]|nr:pyridoxamine 5'-phosphate oxidase [Hyphomicrobiales bacterium]
MSVDEDAAQDFTLSDDPWTLFALWMTDAEGSEINDPNAMALATVDPGGMPNVRTVLLKGLDERGFVFYTNYESAKGRELLGQRKAAICFHWKGLRRQVRARGDVETVAADEADAYFASRAAGSRIGAWASQQSRPLESRAVLEVAVADLTAKHTNGEILRPAHWSGFRIIPSEIEFWQEGDFRLHDRIVFRRGSSGAAWLKTRLYP